MTMQPLEREQQRLREIAREYRQRGYEVLLSPRADQLPDFLAPFQIDMLARNAAENVVVEVRTQESLAATLELDAVAVALHEKSNWRFELVVTNPKDPSTLAIKGATALDQTDFTYRLHEARQLSAQEHGEAAFLLAWSALEALLRTIARSEGIATEQQDSAQ
ncbi:MAG: hypothetical protein MUD01_04470 [Chloroflexaceae bacterium]|nr:hypothetical protein [Chloroflexaceae bacterium]